MSPLHALENAGTYGLKRRFQNLLRPLTRGLAHAGIRANHVTVFACALSVAFGLILVWKVESRGLFLIAPAFLFIRMALNAIDGMLARDFDHKSALGSSLNELGDLISHSFCCLPFSYLPEIDALWICAVIAHSAS